MKPIVVVKKKIVKNDFVLNRRFKIAVKIKQVNTIRIIHIIPNASPDKNIPPGTFVNLKTKVVKSPTDKSPNVIFSLRSVVIIAGNVLRLAAVFAKSKLRIWALTRKNGG